MDMIRNFMVVILPILLCLQTIVSSEPLDQAESRSKRFTLQDLLASQSGQPSSGATQTVSIQDLLAAAQKAQAAPQPQPVQTGQTLSSFFTNKKPVDIDVAADKNGNINLGDLGNLIAGNAAAAASPPSSSISGKEISLNDLQTLLAGQKAAAIQPTAPAQNVNHEEIDLGHEKLEIESAGKRDVHYTLVKGLDGGFNLVPVVEGAAQHEGGPHYELLQPKEGDPQKGLSRQQLQMTTLSQALYSPFPSDQNTLHLHLRGKDGKDGKPGSKGPMGPLGPKGPDGPKGPKGDPGTCSNQINGLFECTPDELDSLSNRVDYLEKICKKKAPPPPFKPEGTPGTEGNPLPSCQAVYEKNPDSKSGAYWLMVNGVRFKTWCEFIRPGDATDDERPPLSGGWTLVARIKGQADDWSPVSENWASNGTISENTAYDMSKTTSMKNLGYTLIKSNVLLLCFTGRNTGCAPFTHGRNMALQELFKTQFGVVPEEEYTMAPFMKSIGKSCDLSILRQSWCGLNLANVCDAKNADPNEKPPKTTHIVRIGCIGDRTATCFPDDYAVGVGVTSCKDGFGCSNVGPSKNMHYRCDYVYGAFSQTAYLYVL